ncbi:unnamed protein product [Lota lota]
MSEGAGGEEEEEEGEEEEEEEEEEEVERVRELEDDDEWGDSGSDFDLSYRSGGSLSSLNVQSGEDGGVLPAPWDRMGVGQARAPPSSRNHALNNHAPSSGPPGPPASTSIQPTAERGSSDSEGDPLLDAVWTLRDRERFKAQEMERHQAQLTMYRRLALIRWVRTLQSHVAGQQDRLQSSFDVILTHRKELLRMGAAAGGVASVAPPPAATAVVGQS